MKTLTTPIIELQYADDAAVPSHTAAGLQRNFDAITASYQHAGQQANTRNTEIISTQPDRAANIGPPFTIQGDPYLGSIISTSCDLTSEIQHRIKQALMVFGQFWH